MARGNRHLPAADVIKLARGIDAREQLKTWQTPIPACKKLKNQAKHPSPNSPPTRPKAIVPNGVAVGQSPLAGAWGDWFPHKNKQKLMNRLKNADEVGFRERFGAAGWFETEF